MATPPPENQAFLREVDEEYRRDQLVRFWRRWGRWLVAGVVVVLLGLALWLYLSHRDTRSAELQGERFDTALHDLAEDKVDSAQAVFTELSESDRAGYAAMSRFSEANIALANDNLAEAAATFGAIANDESLPEPFRNLALVRQTLAEYEQMEPAAVIERLGPLANPDSPFFGTAGEMVAAAYLKQGKRQEAGELYGQIARTESVPSSVRQRAVQIAGVLGVDTSETLDGESTDSSEATNEQTEEASNQ
ncbi:tetratricopeptide repeat protein [Sphingosinithalassobacter sp. LHW66-3]|uniref:tetratricopeptide repeat protein n=1 Tax=Sphingosinithalassobacter sp. LHW66-3 TaxID=3424718 RepID=UPI003D6AB5FA